MSFVRMCSAVLVIAVIALVLGGAGSAHAAAAPAPTPNENYVSGGAYECGVASGGGRDRAGALYSRCTGYTIAIRSVTGTTKLVHVPVGTGGIKPFGAIAPTPDGSAIYTVATSKEAAATLGMSLQRLTFNAARTALTRDASFVPQQFQLGATKYDVCGYDIATDAYGYVYISQGGWCGTGTGVKAVPSPNLILKYAPNGRVVTGFGEFGEGAGQLRVNMKLAVTPDGRRVYVAEHSNRRIQYFDWTTDGSYVSAGSFNSVTVNGTKIPFSATYGVALDPWGFVYVADTTSATIWKTKPNGEYVARVVALAKAPGYDPRLHILNVDGRGDVLLPEAMTRYQRAAGNPYPASVPAVGPEPKADLVAPVLRGISAPERTTEASVTVTIDATDDTGVTQMRFADEHGEWGAWQKFASRVQVPLTSGFGYKRIYVQVRDIRGDFSEQQFVVVQRVSLVVADTTAPTVSLSAPSSTPISAPVVRVTVNATDAIGVTMVRIAREDGTFGEWQSWSSARMSVDIDLGSAPGYRMVFVQAMDAAFNISETASVAVLVEAPASPTVSDTAIAPRVPAPAAATAPIVTGGGTVATQPAGAHLRDAVAPVVQAFRTPSTSCSRAITVRIAARDNVRVAKYRIANEDGRFGVWKAYRPSVAHRLTSGTTVKRITVQVADAAGNVSTSRSVRVVVKRCR